MANENNAKINTQETLNKIIDISNREFNNLNDGEKITLKDLIGIVVAETGIPTSKATGLVQTYAHECSAVKVELGRNGGIFKGGRPVRVDARPRCNECHQVVRPIGIGSKTINQIEEVINEEAT